MNKLGHFDHIDAFEFAHHLCLVASGSNPTLGWTNWFAPIDVLPNTYAFMQVPTMSRALPVAMPFLVNGVFTSNGMKEVVVRHLTKGKPTDVRVAVRQILPTEEAIISALLPSSTLSYLRARGDDPTVPRVGASFATMLGAVDIPFGCGSWSNPHSARRHEVHLEVEALLARPADIEQAVLDCFKCDAVAAALASLLTPAGWVDGLPAFQKAIESTLLAMLGSRLVTVRVTAPSRRLDAEPPVFQGRPRLHAVPAIR